MSSEQTTLVRAVPIQGTETYREKAERKFRENPWVPIGCAATVGALVMAMMKMRRGESRSFNHWLRVRVAAQGATIVALCAGTWSLRPQAVAQLQNPDADIERRRLDKIAKEKEEFEERLRDAEVAHGLETEFRKGNFSSGAAAVAAAMPEEMDATAASPPPATTSVPQSSSGGGRTWLRWFGRSTSSKSSKQDDDSS